MAVDLHPIKKNPDITSTGNAIAINGHSFVSTIDYGQKCLKSLYLAKQ